jgi:hypothetical protein
MRPAVLAVLFAALPCAADEPPVPQNPPAQARARADALAWHRAMTVEAYDKVGRRDPRWDAAARRALEACAAAGLRGLSRMDSARVAQQAADEALKAGCDDPLVRYVAGRDLAGFATPDPVRWDRLVPQAAADLAASGYPAVRKAIALTAAATGRLERGPPSAADKEAARGYLDRCVAVLPAACADPHPEARRVTNEVCKTVLGYYARLANGDWEAAVAKVRPAFKGTPRADALTAALTGHALVQYAWDARGTALAEAVPEDGRRLFEARLEKAEEALRAAWKADPTDPPTAVSMMTVCQGRGHPRAEMEVWFKRAMDLDGDSLKACAQKGTYLQPKWHGSEAEAVAFAKALVATGNYEADLPLLAVIAHLEMSLNEPEGYIATRQEVWDELRAVMAEAVRQHPDSKAVRTYVGKYCARFGKWADADAHFRAVGKDYWRPSFPSEAEARDLMGFCRRMAEMK